MAKLLEFNIGGRVTRTDSDKIGLIERIGPPIEYPGHGPTRKIRVEFPDNPGQSWYWEFELEAW
jgi:hypothetical protein